ncbi:centrosomal protein of 104 kDa-like isoform X2 [Tachypleus tridentatus]|uniref:centrosomal protein of 104 kDa-like isoform X2 n=1 Tax=Tachypleus tridentatus TaxID=6853 RepID=UPI003FD5A363
MPHKIDFRVVQVSGEDENYLAAELNEHDPTTKGWQSKRYPHYPQELVLKLETKTKVYKLQILSHQYLIASKIDLFFGTLPKGEEEIPNDPKIRSKGKPKVPRNMKWVNVGQISLSENVETDYKARELKSALLDSAALYIKLVFHQNHVNRFNTYSQIGVVAINIIGEEMITKEEKPNSFENKENEIKNDVISPLDDLSISMYVEGEVVTLLRKLEVKKQKAISEERFVYAKKLKNAMKELKEVGEKLGKFTIEKQMAVELEDFDEARAKKKEIDEYRLEAYERLGLPDLLEMDGYNPILDMSQGELKLPKVETVKTPPPPPKPKAPTPSPKPSGHPRKSPNSFTAYEDRIIPSLKSGKTTSPSDSLKSSIPEFPDEDLEELKYGKMSEKDKTDAALSIEIFGLPVVERAYSKVFSNREMALKEIQKFHQKYKPKGKFQTSTDVLKATTYILERTLKDKVLSVFILALELMKIIFTQFLPSNRVPKNEISVAINRTLPLVIMRTGDTAPRIRSTAAKFVLEMADYKDVKSLRAVPTHTLQPFPGTINSRLAQSRCELVEALLRKYSINDRQGLTVGNVMLFSIKALAHPAGQVREVAERIIIDLYKTVGKLVKQHLPRDKEKTRKNIMFRRIFKEFDKIDRQGDRESSDREEEIRKLKSRLNMIGGFGGGPSRASSLQTSPKRRPQRRRSSSLDMGRVSFMSGHNSRSVSRANQSLLHLRSDSWDEDNITELDLEKICMFCEEKNDSFNPEQLDLHYYKDCPMLMLCQNCKQVVEIAGYTEHLLVECDSQDQYKQCLRCKEAIPLKGYQVHTRLKKCIAAKPEKIASRCPLCHQNISPGEAGWQAHLMKEDGCAFNPRRKGNSLMKRASKSKKNTQDVPNHSSLSQLAEEPSESSNRPSKSTITPSDQVL